jgi:hypothetical protein
MIRKSMQRSVDLLMPPFTYGAQDVLFDGPTNGMVTVHGKGRPIAGRLSHFAQKYMDHDPWLAQQLSTGYAWRVEGHQFGPTWIENSKACLKYMVFVREELQAWLAMGALQLYSERIFKLYGPPIVVSALHVADNGKLRLIIDLRVANHADPDRKVMYECILEDFIPFLRPGTLLFKEDVRSGYFHIPMRECDAPYLAVSFFGLLFYLTTLPFGLGSACKFFERARYPLRATLRALGKSFIGYLDDSGHDVGCDPDLAYEDRLQRLDITTSYGWALGKEKVTHSSPLLEILGLHLDTTAQVIHVSEGRQDKFWALWRKLHALPHTARVPARTVARFAGYLVSMDAAAWHAQRLAYPFLYCIAHIFAGNLWKAKVCLSQQALFTLSLIPEWWTWAHGKPFTPPSAQIALASDSSDYAWGATYSMDGSPPLCEEDIAPDCMMQAGWPADYHPHIMLKELLAHLQTLKEITPLVSGKCLASFIDNQAAYYYLKKGGGSQSSMADIAWQITEALVLNKVKLVMVSWVPSVLNMTPDKLSRTLASTRGWQLNPKLFRWAMFKAKDHGLPTPTIDAFATPEDALLPKFISRFRAPEAFGTDFFSCNIAADEVLWCHPPWFLLSRTFAHLASHKQRAYVLVPHWRSKPWFVWVTRAQWRLVLPASQGTFLLPHNPSCRPQPLAYHCSVIWFSCQSF